MLKRGSRERAKFLEAWAFGIRSIIAREFGVKVDYVFPPPKIQAVNGPRVAGLKLFGGNKIGEVVSLLERNGMANLRQSIPKEEEHPDCIDPRRDPLSLWWGRWYVVQLAWADRLAEDDIQTQTLLRGSAWSELEASGDKWLVGLEEHYEPVYLSLDIHNGSPHYFFIGTTQSGKSTAVENAVAQLALCPKNRFMFIDVMKKLRDWKAMPALSQCVGPPATDIDDARDALLWLRSEMDARYNGFSQDGRIIVVIDELPGLRDDKTCVDIVEAIASAGAQCDIFLLLAAQHAIEKALGPFAGILKANVSGRAIFHTSQLSGSVAGMHDNRALFLGTPGDCWVFNANLPTTRVQASYFPKEFLKGEKKWNYGPPQLERWPVIDREKWDTGNGGGFSDDLVAKAVAFRLRGRITGEKKGYGRTVVQEKFGLCQNESVRLIRVADAILDQIWKVGQEKKK